MEWTHTAAETEPEDTGSGKTAYLSAVQKAVTTARKHDIRLRKINEEKTSRQRLWQQYVETTKRKFAKQKREYEMDMQKLEADREAALEAGQLAAAQVKAIVVGQKRPEPRTAPLEAEEAWESLWRGVEAAPSGATFLDEAIAAAAASGMDIEFPGWEEPLPSGMTGEEARTPVPVVATAAPPGLPPPSYTAMSPGTANARSAPYPTVPIEAKAPDVPHGDLQGHRGPGPHPGQRDLSLRRTPTHEEAPRPNIKDATKLPHTRPALGPDIQERLDMKRAQASGAAMRPFRFKATEEMPPSEARSTGTEETKEMPSRASGIPILEDDEDSAEHPAHE